MTEEVKKIVQQIVAEETKKLVAENRNEILKRVQTRLKEIKEQHEGEQSGIHTGTSN